MGQTAGTKKHNARRKTESAENGRRFVRLRIRGYSNAEIARKCGVAESTVCERITAHLARPVEGADKLRDIELAKCDDRERIAHAARANAKGDPLVAFKSLSELHRIAERRAKLLGLDAPVRSIQTEEELETAMNKLRDRLTPEEFEKVVSILADVSVQHGEGQQDGAGRAPVSGGDRGTEGGPKGA